VHDFPHFLSVSFFGFDGVEGRELAAVSLSWSPRWEVFLFCGILVPFWIYIGGSNFSIISHLWKPLDVVGEEEFFLFLGMVVISWQFA